MILSIEESRRLEEMAFESGITAERLMDEVGRKIAGAIAQFFPKPGICTVYAGKGNNGGDALVAAAHLADAGWEVAPKLPCFEQELGMLPKKKLRELRSRLSALGPVQRDRPHVVLDGLLGVGASGALRENIRTVTRQINALRRESDAYIFSVDLPSGLNGEDGHPDPDTVEADFTLAVGFAKDVLVRDEATQYVGRLAVVPLAPLTDRAVDSAGNALLTTGATLSSILPRRRVDSHKTEYGRIAILAGNTGTTGAAVLCAAGALHAGAGLVTVYTAENAYPVVAASAPPEAMVRPVKSYLEVLEAKHDVLAIGPGLGTERAKEVLDIVEQAPLPTVIDADALNVLPNRIEVLSRCVGQRLLTPHSGEMARLSDQTELSRRELAEWFTLQFPVTLLLKGARTLVSERGRRISYNSTGNAGMSTGGMGDALTGVCAALIGQGLSPYDAARAGAWLCGRAAELALFAGPESQESLSATSLFPRLGQAFEQMRHSCY